MLRFGPDDAPKVVIVLPLLEEANRTRAFAATICRGLARMGIGSILPDLPGQGDSLRQLQDCSMLDISGGVEAAIQADWNAGTPVYGVAIRSGALLDKLALLSGRWHFAPQAGSDVLREWKRIKQASSPDRLGVDDVWYIANTDDPIEIGGNLISPDLLTALSVYQPWQPVDGGPVRTVRLTTDPTAADRKIDGMPLWRRSEPGNDSELAELLAADIADWIASCAR